MTGRRIKSSRKTGLLLKSGFYLYLCLSLFAIVWLRAAVVNLEYELGELDNLRAELIRERSMVMAKRASFYAPEKVEKVAVKRLGMTMPERENVFFVKRSSAAVPVRTSLRQ